MADVKPAEVSAILKEQLSGIRSEAELKEVGTVLTIGDGCDIALNTTVMEKVKMGNFSVAGAGAMVLKDVEEYQVVVGNPARHLKYVKPEETKSEFKETRGL